MAKFRLAVTVLLWICVIPYVRTTSSAYGRQEACGDQGICSCDSYKGKGTNVLCSSRNLTQAPFNFPLDAVIINLCCNRIGSIPANAFSRLTALSELYLQKNRLEYLPGNVFLDLAKLECLYLTNNQLKFLPENIFSNLAVMSELDIGYNQLEKLPANIFSNLTNLKELDLSRNSLTFLPENIFSSLYDLNTIYLSYNNLASLPERVFASLNKLNMLHLDHNNLISLPESIFAKLVNVSELDLAYNTLEYLPEKIFSRMTSLGELHLEYNDLTTLPEKIFLNLFEMWTVDVKNNRLEYLPEIIFSDLINLYWLHLNDNKLTTLPENIFSELADLSELRLDNNNLVCLPDKIFLNLDKLKILRLEYNNLTSFPGEIFSNLIMVRIMYLHNNKLSLLPENIFDHMTHLQTLHLDYNNLSSLPENIFSQLTGLYTLNLAENNLEYLPKNLFPSDGRQFKIRNLFLNKNKIRNITEHTFSGLGGLELLLLNDNKIQHISSGAFMDGPGELYLFNNEMAEVERDTFGSKLEEVHLYGNVIPKVSLDMLSKESSNLTLYLACDKTQQISFRKSDHYNMKVICLSQHFSFNLFVDKAIAEFLNKTGFQCQDDYVCTPCKQGYYGRYSGGCQECPAGGYYQDDIAKASNSPNNIECKHCNAGTYVRNGTGVSSDDCIVCPDGTNKTKHAGFRACFCLEGYARTDRFNACKLCQNKGLDCNGRDYMRLRKGYFWKWDYPEANLTEYGHFVDNLRTVSPDYDPVTIRYNGDIPVVHECPIPESCSNNESHINGTCSAGYGGLLCTKCVTDYYEVLGHCLKCPPLVYSIIEVVCTFLVIICCYLLIVWQYRKQKRQVGRNGRSFLDMFMSRVKIVLGFYQVVGEFLTSVHELHWAGTLSVIGEFISTLELNVLKIFIRPSCYVDLEINTKLEFIIAMALLAFVLFVPLVYYQLKKRYLSLRRTTSSRDSDISRTLQKTKSKLFTCVLVILFLTYPPTCSIIFKLYPPACEKFCWDNSGKHCVEVLRSDFALECNKLHVYQAFAFSATILYVVAFPLCLLFLLMRRTRNELSTCDQTARIVSNEICVDDFPESTTPIWLTFLCGNYKAKYWFWEILELVRKVAQTVTITLLGWENRITEVLTIGTSVLFLVLHARYLPMKSSMEQKLQMFCLTAILMNILIAFVDYEESEVGLTVFLILLNLVVVVIVVGELFLGLLHMMMKVKVHRRIMSCALNVFNIFRSVLKKKHSEGPLFADDEDIPRDPN